MGERQNKFKPGQHVEVLKEPRGDRYGDVVSYEQTMLGVMVRVHFQNGMPDGLFREGHLREV